VVRRWTPVVLAAALAASVAGLAGGPAYASAGSRPVLSVGGEVTTAASYTVAQLAALPQTTATVTVGGKQVTDTGVLLETLVTNAGPAYPASLLNTKNELLRVTVTVRGAGHRPVTFAVGELDAGFGNHPALLALTQNGHRIAPRPCTSRSWDRAERRPTPRSARPCSRCWPPRGSGRRSTPGSRPWASTITWPRSPRPSSWWADDRCSCR